MAIQSPPFSQKWFRCNGTFNYDITKQLPYWLRLAQLVFPGKSAISSGPGQVSGKLKTEVKLQLDGFFNVAKTSNSIIFIDL
jgi:hypothetical protein